VFANLVGATARLILSFAMTTWRPTIQFRWHEWRELARFGRWVYLNSTALFLSQQADKVIIGKVLGTHDLGLYQIAFRIVELPLGQISLATHSLTLPALSRLQAEPDRMRSAFLRVFVVALVLLLPAFAFLSVYAGAIVAALLGPPWKAIPGLVRVLALGTVVTAVDHLMTPLLYAQGKPRLESLRSFTRVVVLVLVVPIAAHAKGLVGASWGVALASMATLVLAPWIIRATGLKPLEILWPLGGAVLLGGIVAAVGIATPRSLPPWAAIAFGLAVGGGAVGGAGYWLSLRVAALAPLRDALAHARSAVGAPWREVRR
jgi:PST family polysaccharide transporter